MLHPLRIGIVGLGKISQVHLEAFQQMPNVVIQAVSDIDPAKVTALNKKQSCPYASENIDSLVKDKHVDCVDICLPHFLHANTVIKALKAGKEVICEKPLALNLDEVQEIEKIAARMHRHVYVKHYMRFSRLHHRMKGLLDARIIGRPYYVEALSTSDSLNDYANPQSWKGDIAKAGGGVFADVGIHIIDVLQDIYGSAHSIHAVMSSPLETSPAKGELMASVTLNYQDGLIAHIACSAIDNSYGFRWDKHIFGTDGSIQIEEFGKSMSVLKVVKHQKTIVKDVEIDWWKKANTLALLDSVTRIQENRVPAISFNDIKDEIRTISVAYDSAKQCKVLAIKG